MKRHSPNQRPFVSKIEAIGTTELKEAPSTPGILRELAFSSKRAIFIRAKVAGNIATGWHHHGDREVFGYVVRGRLRFEYGPGGKETTNVDTNGYFHLPPSIIHRDVNAWPEEQELVIAFVGTGPLVVNVDGPEPP